ncbi:MAG: putative thioredoxin [Pseudonocardiales bacterium]|jgi:putative thioredoxin|nr:putative thioredoxin [Pseudonocardiales bacterium]
MAGAVDLAAVKARSEAAARAAEAPAPAAGSYVVAVTEASFQSEVLDRSFQVPVLLVLTSPRAPSSAQLVSAFEPVVTAGNGALVLREIDVDANPRIAQALQVQGVPAVFAVISGQLIPGFEGVLPEAQINEFVAAVMQAGREAGLTGAAGAPEAETDAEAQEAPDEPEDPRFVAAEEALEAGDFALAAQRYQAILDQEPANQEATLALGQVRLLQRLESVDRDAAQRAESAPDDVDAQLAAADLLFAGNDVTSALDRLLKTVALTSGDDRDRVRTRLLEFFDLLGPDDPRVPAARRELARALF